jgi:hypothetical protein
MPHSANNSTSTQTKMSRPSSTSTNSATNAFPKQAGAAVLATDAIGGEQLSPAPSHLSFAQSIQAERIPAFDESRLKPTAVNANTGRPYSRQRAQYFEEQFAYKDGTTSSARDRVTKDAPIVAELRTNVIVGF